MDPLSVLREFTINNRLEAIREDADRFHFGDSYSFPKVTTPIIC
jgi:hypothetical protein